MKRDWYFIAVRKDGNVVHFTNIGLTDARNLFNKGGEEFNYCQYGRSGEEHAENIWCDGATF